MARRKSIYSESQIQSQIINFLRYRGYYVQRMNSGAMRDRNNHLVRMARAGTPDLLAFKVICASSSSCDSSHLITELLFIEVKTPGNKPTPLQQAVMDELEEHGARCLVIHSIEELEGAL